MAGRLIIEDASQVVKKETVYVQILEGQISGRMLG